MDSHENRLGLRCIHYLCGSFLRYSSGWYLKIYSHSKYIYYSNTYFSIQVITGSEAGFAISSAISLSQTLQWGLRMSFEVVNKMTSVERVIEYGEIPSESVVTQLDCGMGKNYTFSNNVRKNYFF